MIDLNILDIIFLNLAFSVTFMGFLINNFEKYLPAFVIKGYKYGCFAYQGPGGGFLQIIEMPKSYYRHFYLFSSIFGITSLIYMTLIYFFNFNVNRFVIFFLRILLQQEEASVSAFSAIIAMTLLVLQCVRRLYDTYYLQVFAKTSKINLSHYLAGIIHYFGCIIAILGQSPAFSGSQSKYNIMWGSIFMKLMTISSVIIFLWAWYEQYQTNIIFATMRRDKKTGQVVSEDHGVPYGRLFEKVSSPHRMCEIVMYTVLLLFIPTRTFFCIYLWVLSNQIQTAIQAHDWYKQTFKNYPANRKAICPLI